MIRLKSEMVRPADGKIDLAFVRKQAQWAIELEHSTIPPYLTAYFSVKPDSDGNQAAAKLVRSVVIEEMLHMTLAANLLNAIGGEPVIDHSDFIPKYPGNLPGGVDPALQVGLAPLSKSVVKEVFMEIEEPEKPLDFEATPLLSREAAPPEFHTIGEFYASIVQNLTELVKESGAETVFSGAPSRQFHGQKWFKDDAIEVTDLDSAKQAIDLIVSQGEGNLDSPLDEEGQLAHYYRFSEIFEGRRLIRVSQTGSVEDQWKYAGDPIPLEAEGIYPLKENAVLDDYQEGSAAWIKAQQFDYSYTGLLKALHRTFNGDPDYIDQAMGLMYTLTIQAQALVKIPLGDGTNASPPFQYQPTLATNEGSAAGQPST